MLRNWQELNPNMYRNLIDLRKESDEKIKKYDLYVRESYREIGIELSEN